MKSTSPFNLTKIALFILIFFNIPVKAQINVLLNPINPMGQKNLFDLTLVNNTVYNGSVTLVAHLRTERGELLMTQKTSSDISSNGMTVVNSQNILETQFADFDYKSLYEQHNGLPVLNYVLCVEVYANENRTIAGESCTEFFAVDVLTLLPVYPNEDDVIYEERPLFQWMMSGVQNDHFDYGIRLAKIEGSENPNKSLRRNQLLINKNRVDGIGLNYPYDGVELEMGERYVWQIDVKRGDDVIMKSDAWVFTVEDTKKYLEIPKDLSYVDITELVSGANLFAVGEFKFKFPSLKETILEAQLFELKDNEKKQIDLEQYEFNVVPGSNKFKLDLNKQVYLKHLKHYSLSLKDTQSSQIYQMFIQYVNPDYIK